MGVRTWAPAFLILGLGRAILCPDSCRADRPTPVTWKKTTIEGKFRSEGVAVADVNKDGKPDVLIGDSWYEAPAWTKHDIRKPGDYGDGLHSYSECMAAWADDINRDGWPDQIVIGFPGKPAAWYENPKGQDQPWARHEIASSACNETPLYTDLLGDGRRVLIMGVQPRGQTDQGQMVYLARRRPDPTLGRPPDQRAQPAGPRHPRHLAVLPRAGRGRPQRRRAPRRDLHRGMVGAAQVEGFGLDLGSALDVPPGQTRRRRGRHDRPGRDRRRPGRRRRQLRP